MTRTERPSPAGLTPSWPGAPSPDYAAEQARLFALSLRSAIGGQSLRAVAREAGVDEGTVRRVLAGATWPDLRTIALLERSLACSLYGQSRL